MAAPRCPNIPMISKFLTQQHPGLVRPQPRHVLDLVPAPAQHQHGDAKRCHELVAGCVAPAGQVEHAQLVTGNAVGTCTQEQGGGGPRRWREKMSNPHSV